MRLVEEVHLDAIDTCARVYGFSASEAKSKIGNVVLMCGGGSVMEKKAKNPVEKKISSKVKLALPFSGAVLAGCCGGLKQNHGLLSQCTNEVSSGYCSGCKKQCDKNASGKPDCGSIEDRMTAFTAGVDFRDPKGRAPVAYAKVMQKLKITEEEVLAEVAKFNVTLRCQRASVGGPRRRVQVPRIRIAMLDPRSVEDPRRRQRPLRCHPLRICLQL